MDSCFLLKKRLFFLVLYCDFAPPIDSDGWSARQLAQHHKKSPAVNSLNISLSFSPFSVFLRQNIYSEINVCKGRTDLHRKSVIQQRLALRFVIYKVGLYSSFVVVADSLQNCVSTWVDGPFYEIHLKVCPPRLPVKSPAPEGLREPETPQLPTQAPPLQVFEDLEVKFVHLSQYVPYKRLFETSYWLLTREGSSSSEPLKIFLHCKIVLVVSLGLSAEQQHWMCSRDSLANPQRRHVGE